jgi:hypothetical protein
LKGSRCFLSRQESRQQELQPSKQEMEVIAGGGQHGVNGIAGMVCKIIAAHAMFGLKMTDHRFDGDACRRSSRLIRGVSRRFWPDVQILKL